MNAKIHRPITRQWKHLLTGGFRFIISPKWFFNYIYDLLTLIECLTECEGEVETVEGVADGLTVLREPDDTAKITIVINKGPGTLTVREGGNIIAIIAAGKKRTLPMGGRGQITADSTEADTEFVVTTYRRCLCGDAPEETLSYDDPMLGQQV